MTELWNFYQNNTRELLEQLVEHLSLTLFSVLLAIALSVPLGIFIYKRQKLSPGVLYAVGILQTIPSIALLGFLIPLLGIGVKPAIFALFLYSLLPIVRNVYTGLNEIDPSITEAARAMGMNKRQVTFRVEIPLALPTIFAGIRTATVINVGMATLAAYIAAGGLGEFIFGGIALNNTVMIIAGALPAALLAIILDALLSILQKSGTRKLNKGARALGIILVILVSSMTFKAIYSTPLQAGFPPEFIGRKDGLPALKKTYNLRISSVMLSSPLMYKALADGRVDVISGYSTDGRIKAYDLKILKDDKNSFPPYEACWLHSSSLLKEHPELKKVIHQFQNLISNEEMTQMNFEVDHKNKAVADVARNFLERKGLNHKARQAEYTITIASKTFTEQYILGSLFEQLAEGQLPVNVKQLKGLGGTKICLTALENGDIDLYPEYTGTAYQVILEEQSSIGDKKELHQYLQAQLLQQKNLVLSEPLGFENAYALMMRREQADSLNIHTISDLQKYLAAH